ncbi:unnamed protein product [Dovyalis caffra]|uniref:SHSP domain-containing protein n=1 Tax=Dovyalis caffra TaxID=77055 RepID=A0AAV1RY60_9ROSI|nr:unnamed protein product [Dovyalis caffra]
MSKQPRPRIVYQHFEPTTSWKRDPPNETLLIHLPGFKREQLKLTYVSASRMLIVSGEGELDRDSGWSRFRKEIPISSNCRVHEMRAQFDGDVLSVILPCDPVTEPRTKPFSARQIRECFSRHVKNGEDKVLGWNEIKNAFSELGASYPDFRADRALVFADGNGDGLISTDYEMDELVSYAWLVFWQPEGKSSDHEEMGMVLSDEELRVVLKRFEDNNVVSKQDLKKAFNHFGLFFPEYAEHVLDHSDKEGFRELKQLDDLVRYAVQFGYTVK